MFSASRFTMKETATCTATTEIGCTHMHAVAVKCLCIEWCWQFFSDGVMTLTDGTNDVIDAITLYMPHGCKELNKDTNFAKQIEALQTTERVRAYEWLLKMSRSNCRSKNLMQLQLIAAEMELIRTEHRICF
jgi:hypothetical protein